ncbi:MAG: hypothetical protein JO218_04825 [Burkholderiales bacterium]|nr:hypothetical protein [Burkholderiales bacterium]
MMGLAGRLERLERHRVAQDGPSCIFVVELGAGDIVGASGDGWRIDRLPGEAVDVLAERVEHATLEYAPGRISIVSWEYAHG